MVGLRFVVVASSITATAPRLRQAPTPPPAQFADEFTIPDWWLQFREPIYAAWDGSWYADFPSTADLARRYYDAGQNPGFPVDGVFVIDITAFEYILSALGSVEVPEYDAVITPVNFRQVVYDIRAYGEGVTPHKQFVATVYQQIFTEWQTVIHDQDTRADLLGAALKALGEKHLMFYFTDERLNNAVALMNWGGIQEPATENDYIMVADANLGNKSNNSILRQLTYDVDVHTDGTLTGRLTVAYDYSDFIATDDPAVDPEFHGQLNYNNLLQVFVPAETELESTSNLENGYETVNSEYHTIFVTRVTVEYDNRERFQYTYNTPILVESFGTYHRYRLLIQKQPGTREEYVTVTISLPVNATVISTDPVADATYNLARPIIEFRVDLLSDQWIEVIYQ